jgi:hypothetical protein
VPIHFALLGRKRKYVKSKTTAKLREKRTSIAAVRDKLGPFDTFLTLLLSHCRLPLKIFLNNKIIILQTLVGHTGGQFDIHPGDGRAHRSHTELKDIFK